MREGERKEGKQEGGKRKVGLIKPGDPKIGTDCESASHQIRIVGFHLFRLSSEVSHTLCYS